MGESSHTQLWARRFTPHYGREYSHSHMGGKTHTPLWTRVLATRYGQENSHLAMGESTKTPLWAIRLTYYGKEDLQPSISEGTHTPLWMGGLTLRYGRQYSHPDLSGKTPNHYGWEDSYTLWARVLTPRNRQEYPQSSMGEITHTPLWARVHIPTMSESTHNFSVDSYWFH